jgi:tRNA(Met) C34 N-acetyltransferase TmcA
MTNDLVKLLRQPIIHTVQVKELAEILRYEAADRIEQLENSLILISGFNEHNHPCKKEIDDVIRDALGDEND